MQKLQKNVPCSLSVENGFQKKYGFQKKCLLSFKIIANVYIDYNKINEIFPIFHSVRSESCLYITRSIFANCYLAIEFLIHYHFVRHILMKS